MSTSHFDVRAMTREVNSERVWPYVLPFPLDSEKRRLIWSILQSRVGSEILGELRVDEQTYQHDLIEKLPYSNKSIIKYLKKLVKAGILEQGMKVSTDKRRNVWIKWYEPTSLGKWLILFLKLPSQVSLELTKKVVEELFRLYSSSIVEVCQRYSLDIDSFHRDLDKQYLLEITKKPPEIKPKVAVFGSAALDVHGRLKRLPASDEIVYVDESGRYPGGMGSNVSVALSKLGVPAAFFGRIGNDSTGRSLLENLARNNVGLSNAHVVDAPSLQTLILSDNQKHRWLFVVGSSHHAISLKSLEEIDWKIVDHCKVVYIGEVFTEIASSVADYARTRNKAVIYRPGVPYMLLGVENLRRILEHATLFILNKAGWKQLKNASKERIETPADLLKYGTEKVLLTKGAEGCEIFSADTHQRFSVPPQLQRKFKPIDPTGAGDGFSAGLIKGLLNNWSVNKAVVYGQAVASITCSRVGASNAFPTEKEVEAALNSR